jgi:hypothetical protein
MKDIGTEIFLKKFADSPPRLSWAQACLSDGEKVRAFLAAVDASPYSLAQWADAFILLDQWLEARGLQASFRDQLGYVGCACEAAGAAANMTPLSAIVSDMLEDYGFENAAKN